uniref:BTB domain-containing protein n=1 Tax=Oryza barthii TaxID=65489 RepID=A0A0D3GXL3_9ORYZ
MCVNLQGGDKIEMIRHLLVAADRYAMDRLKLICQHILGKSLHVDNVVTTLALADQHSCDKLKKVCIEFMASSNAMDAVAATGGYANLKRTSPSLLIDVRSKRRLLAVVAHHLPPQPPPPIASALDAPKRGMVSKKKKTVSRHTTESEEGRHSFEIVGYSLKKGIGVDEFVESATFAVGGYDWCIRFYPDGKGDGAKDYISVYLELLTKDCAVRAAYDLRLVNLATGLPKSVYSETTHRMFNSEDSSKFAPHYATFMHRSQLEMEASGYIKDDRLTIECFVTVVVQESMASNTVKAHELIKVPPSDILENFGELLEKGEGEDVTFVVGGEKIAAHKIVLAARSSVFKAELYGQMKEKRARRVTVEDMQPDVFRGLLHFIYTDSLPDMDDLSDDDYYEMIRLLLVAADRYAMDRMKLQCESILGEHLDVQTVATTLALADQHNCNGLKDVCIEFIATQNKMDDVVATEGYADLKRTCPSVLVDVFEKASKLRRI